MTNLRKGLIAGLMAATMLAAAPALAERVLSLNESPVGEIDPAKATDYADTVLMINVYDTLVFPKKGSPGVDPLLATEWETDGKTYTFKLKDGVKFHSGNPLTAEDVVFSYNRLVAMGQGFASLFVDKVESVEAVDPTTVKFTLEGTLCAVPRLARAPAGSRFQDRHGQQEGRRLRRVRRLRRRIPVGQGRRLGRVHRREPEPAVRDRDGQVPGLFPRLRRECAGPGPLPLWHGGLDGARGALARRA